VPRVFLLSPANCGGTRAKQVASPRATFALAEQLRSPSGAALGDVFAFVSGLYFRGKLRYATRFAAPPECHDETAGGGVHVITPNAGLRAPATRITCDAVRAFARIDVDADNPKYRKPLEDSCRRLAAELGDACEVVLLGSIASPKYTSILIDIFGARLLFPVMFVGRGDMSRGGLLLRMVAAGTELEYAPVAGSVLHGSRPPRLARLTAPPLS
jgi:hypothetical protein